MLSIKSAAVSRSSQSEKMVRTEPTRSLVLPSAPVFAKFISTPFKLEIEASVSFTKEFFSEADRSPLERI